VDVLHCAVGKNDSQIHREIGPFMDGSVNGFDNTVVILRVKAPGLFFD
jgi:hypothetical protein